jgi:hypothetical protein
MKSEIQEMQLSGVVVYRVKVWFEDMPDHVEYSPWYQSQEDAEGFIWELITEMNRAMGLETN